MSESLWPHGLQHARLPCPSPTLSLLKLMSIESVMPTNHLLPLSSPSPPAFNLSQHQGLFQWVSSSHQGLFQWVSSSHQGAKYWSFSFSISPSNEFSGPISFKIDWFDLAVQGTLQSLLQHHSSKASILQQSENHNHRKLIKLITWTTAVFNSIKLWAMPCRATQDGSWWRVLTKCGPLKKAMANIQYSYLENPMNSNCQIMKWKSLSCVWLCDPWTIQSMEFSRPEYWSGWPFPSPEDLCNPEFKPRSPTLQADSLPAEPKGKAICQISNRGRE